MPRKKKDSKALNILLESAIYDDLEKYAHIQGQTKTTAVERILTEKFNEYFQESKDKVEVLNEQR